ncbi:MAG TPA: PBP1A family penicillin-binding protein [Vicinamibacterales bacterium]|nr:PBP1A family penicillin-binding protein [Vicinamibacterales bacterium]
MLRVRIVGWLRKPWVRVAAVLLAVPFIALCFFLGYYYVSFSELIEARLHGERDTVLPRVFARPLELRRGESMTDRQLIDRLNDLGYAERVKPEHPGEFAVSPGTVSIAPRPGQYKGRIVRVVFQRQPTEVRTSASRTSASSKRTPPKPPDHVLELDLDNRPNERLTLDAPVLTALVNGEREKKRPVALGAMAPVMWQAVLSIEDTRFYEHPGVDPIGMLGAFVRYATGRRSYLAGGSTITQQLVRNVFLPKFGIGMTLQDARERSPKRKLIEIWASLILTAKASKDDILEMYLNDIPLGQRGSFSIFGVEEASRLFFGKNVSNVSLAEAATIAGVIQQPSALSPFTNAAKCRERRNIVLHAMADAGYIKYDAADKAAAEPLAVVERALETEAPYFVDYVGQTLNDQYPGLTTTTTAGVDVYTTLDLHLQKLAQDAVRSGLTHVDDLLSHRRKRVGKPEAALIAVDPRTGEILALVGGRSYNQSQYDRAVVSRRQPGSVFKPFVYLTAFEQAIAQGRTDITPATIVLDEPETFEFGGQTWTPENYEHEYDGPITFRHALAHSRNLATIHVAQEAGYDHVSDLWKTLGVGNPPKPYPSIALGVFEATPAEIATAYTIFPSGGLIRQLKPILRIMKGGRDVTKREPSKPKRIARPETTFLVTNMMRSVLNEGTAASARSMGFTLDAAGKTGTTNDLHDAWFVGFTPDLLTVVWVGFDDNQPVGLSGAQAALPIWTQFMKTALSGRAPESGSAFEAPEGIALADIDPATGKLATPACPRKFTEAFIAGTEPTKFCDLHR